MERGRQAPCLTPPEAKNWLYSSWTSPHPHPTPTLGGHYWLPDLSFIQTTMTVARGRVILVKVKKEFEKAEGSVRGSQKKGPWAAGSQAEAQGPSLTQVRTRP